MTDQLPPAASAGTAVPAGARPARRPPGGHGGVVHGRRVRRLSGGDRIVTALMVGIPALVVVGLVWLPAIASVLLSFTRWEGIGGLGTIEWIGLQNYRDVFTNYPPFWPAVQHNVIWLAALFLVGTPLGILFAVLIDRELRGSRFYQTSLYVPVVLSLALVGFIWQLLYSRDQGLLNALLGTRIDFFGDPDWNLWAALVATGWTHVGYIMLLYLAGLKGVDPALKEAAQVDGAGAVQTFFRVVLPVMRPINIIVLVVTVINSLRAFDIVWVINRGTNGLELIAALVTQNILGEASRIGFGSALATIMLIVSMAFISVYLRIVFREER